jgi:3-keto-L-gulonate-6-phosphate decarboxylase
LEPIRNPDRFLLAQVLRYINHKGDNVKLQLALDMLSIVDLKTMDVGEYESDFCFEAGADIVTVLGIADIDTIKGSIKSAKKHKKKLLVDLINVENQLDRAKEIISNEGDIYLGIHTGIDQQNRGESPLKHLKELSVLNRPLFVAGGINLDNIDEIIAHNPYTISDKTKYSKYKY